MGEIFFILITNKRCTKNQARICLRGRVLILLRLSLSVSVTHRTAGFIGVVRLNILISRKSNKRYSAQDYCGGVHCKLYHKFRANSLIVRVQRVANQSRIDKQYGFRQKVQRGEYLAEL